MSGQLMLASGTFKLTHPSAVARFGVTPTIPSVAGIWVNGGTLNGGNFSYTNQGLVKVSAGSATFGTFSGNLVSNNGNFVIEGGITNISGRLYNATGGSVTISGGTLRITTVGLSIQVNLSCLTDKPAA